MIQMDTVWRLWPNHIPQEDENSFQLPGEKRIINMVACRWQIKQSEHTMEIHLIQGQISRMTEVILTQKA